MHMSHSRLLAAALALLTGAASAAPAGEVLLITGRGTATHPASGAIRDLAKGDAVHAGEVISASVNSYINLRFADGGYVLLRPNTRFAIEAFTEAGAAPVAAPAPAAPAAPVAPAAAPAAGGDWAVSVEAYPTDADARRIARSLEARGLPAEVEATQVRPGTTWHRVYVRPLADRAAAEQAVETLRQRGFRAPRVIAGTTTVTAPAAPLAPAAPTPAPAATPPATEPAPLTAAAEPGTGRAYFRLLKGGFRAISGLIGKNDPAEYRVTTPVATIGIRGTDYVVVLCDAACAKDPVLADSLPDGSQAQGGIIVGTIEGGVFVVNAAGQTAEVATSQYLVNLPDGSQVYLPFEPRFLKIDPIPNPATLCEQ